MVDSVRIKEIHATLGAGEFATWDDNGTPTERYMHMARTLDWLAKAWGLQFNPDGSMMDIRFRKNIAYSKNGKVTIPDGWTRGQFADNKGGGSSGQTGGKPEEERLGIAYQNRCNRYDNFDDKDPKNNTMVRGDVVLCENLLQYFESYLEDMDKGLNWQEMGAGIMPSADGSSYCTYEGIGTLLAEVAYMLSQLSSNIYQTHILGVKNYSASLETLKALGIPLQVGQLPVDLGEVDDLGGSTLGYIPVPVVDSQAVTLHKRIMDVIANLAIINGQILQEPEEETPPPTP